MDVMKKLQQELGLEYAPLVFKSEASAWACADRFDPPMTVILGDCPQYWVVSMADAEKLIQAGYERAPR